MFYVLKIQTAMSGIFTYKVINGSFSCTPDELPQEIATRAQVKLSKIAAYKRYSCREAANTIAQHKAF